jgi:aminopeptidase C
MVADSLTVVLPELVAHLAQGRIPGQWDLAVSLVENFGLVPQHVYPESWNSSNSNTSILSRHVGKEELHLARFELLVDNIQHLL